MAENRLRPLELLRPSGTGTSPVSAAVDAARQLTRHLLPFPGAEAAEPLRTLWAPAASATSAAPGAAPAVQQAASGIVSQAASILDEEMARGVLSARSSAVSPAAGFDAGGAPMMRQLHDFVDQLAAAWPSMQQMWGQAPAAASDSGAAAAIAELRPATRPRRGDSAVVTMILSNDESCPLRLAPVLSDLLGSSGDRISSRDVAISPGEVRLDPGARKELRMTIPIPATAASTRYSGLVVVTGMDDVRAVVSVEVA